MTPAPQKARDFPDLVKTNEGFYRHPRRLLAREITKQRKNAEATNCMPAKYRIKHFLRDMMEEQNPGGTEPTRFSLPLTNKDPAQLLATNR